MRLDLTPPIIVMDTCALPPNPTHEMVTMKMVLILLIIRLWAAEATFDMNLGQMQYVADHLTTRQCRQLIEALSYDRIVIEVLPSGAKVANVSCIRLLLLWDRTDGRGQSFTELSVRLKQIGRRDIADYLSSSVYGEKVGAVYTAMLAKEGADAVSPHTGLLSALDQPAPLIVPSHHNEEHGLAVFYVVALVLGVVAIVLLVAYLVLRRFNWKCKTPKCWIFLKENVPIYVFGLAPEPPQLIERRQLLLAEERASGNPYIV